MCGGSSVILKLSVVVPSLQLSEQGGLTATRGNLSVWTRTYLNKKKKERKKWARNHIILSLCVLLSYVSQLLKLKMSLKEAEREKLIIPFLWCSVLHILEPNVDQVAIVVKNLPASAEDVRNLVRSLGWEDPLEEGMVTHASILTWRIPWTEESGGLQSIGSQWVRQD